MDPKRALRTRIVAARDAAPPSWRARASAEICARVAALPRFRQAKRIALFASIGSEVDTAALATAARGKEIAWPRVAAGAISFHLAGHEALVPLGKWAIPSPPESAPTVEPASIELFVVPGVAFDLAKNRLGYGAGYYDRALAGASGVKVGVGFDLQVVDHLPVSGHDVRMDAVCTEARFLE